MYQVSGTKGFANKYPNAGYALEGDMLAGDGVPNHENLSATTMYRKMCVSLDG
jgi:hypothetical protein